ncbi:hypothetical protein DFH08DRAFT_908328 [Mycena albidolilacea]|uniref:Secreted protein n=1 Tax=Mycena albidolilacea TaxID=1033008 RepID=A0AAD6YX05_9AGAR|nr:hypothetical protein DFH08DRAFT_908328 [Mycena albidolilacea]
MVVRLVALVVLLERAVGVELELKVLELGRTLSSSSVRRTALCASERTGTSSCGTRARVYFPPQLLCLPGERAQGLRCEDAVARGGVDGRGARTNDRGLAWPAQRRERGEEGREGQKPPIEGLPAHALDGVVSCEALGGVGAAGGTACGGCCRSRWEPGWWMQQRRWSSGPRRQTWCQWKR